MDTLFKSIVCPTDSTRDPPTDCARRPKPTSATDGETTLTYIDQRTGVLQCCFCCLLLAFLHSVSSDSAFHRNGGGGPLSAVSRKRTAPAPRRTWPHNYPRTAGGGGQVRGRSHRSEARAEVRRGAERSAA